MDSGERPVPLLATTHTEQPAASLFPPKRRRFYLFICFFFFVEVARGCELTNTTQP